MKKGKIYLSYLEMYTLSLPNTYSSFLSNGPIDTRGCACTIFLAEALKSFGQVVFKKMLLYFWSIIVFNFLP